MSGTGLAERLVNGLAGRMRERSSRRGFLGGAAVVGAALAVDPWSYLTRPASAYSSLCGTYTECSDGYTVFCCTINGGRNSCPSGSFIGGWWKADNSSFCGGAARYYIDCNSYRGSGPACRCNTTSCDHRRVNCNQFRYGQCHLEIPWSRTGPVLCRVVSCTPPWQRWAGICTSSSATDNNTARQTAPCLVQRPPRGHLDSATATWTRVRLRGWAFDPDTPSASIVVAVHEDGRGVGRWPANKLRSDVNRLFGIRGYHGFDFTFTGRPGTHTYSVYGVDSSTGRKVLIGSQRVFVDRAPRGHLDAVTVSGTRVIASGWAFDPDATATSISVDVFEDSRLVGRFPANHLRSDVNRIYAITGNHGFVATFTGTAGTHTYRAFAIDTVAGKPRVLIGSRVVTVG